MKYRLHDLIDIRQFQMLQDRLNEIYSFPSAIIDNDGNILTATGWQDICTQFHRANAECEAECIKSDQYILDHIHEADPAVSYRCPHGLIDNATPIIIEGVHYGNFFTGQFFLEKPDPAFFQAQAKKYGFDETAYLKAVNKVPVWTLEQLNNYLFFIRGLIEVISGIGLKNLREIETKKQIARSEKILASVLNSVPQSIFWKDTNSVYLGCNEAFAKAVGLESPRRIVGKTDYDLPWPRPEAESYRADDQEVMQRNRSKRHIIEPLQQADGSRLWIDTTKVPLIDAIGNPYGILGIYEDITERRKAEIELKTREKQLAESQRIAHIGSWEHNLTTGGVVWSDELFRVLGLDPRKDPADFRMFFDMIHPDDRPALQKAIEETIRTGKHFSIDYRFIMRDGTTRIIHAQAELVVDDSGSEIILSGTGQDITERKEAEENIRQSEEFVRGILNTVDEGFIVINPDYRIITANKAYCCQAGCAEQEILGRHCYEISHRSNRPCFEEGEECAVRRVYATGEPHSALHRHIDSQHEILYVETKAYPIKDAVGRVTSVIETINNITEKYLLEEERLRVQKLESIGTLAGGIAHDFNNLLQGIFGYMSMAKMSVDEPERVKAMLLQAEEALHLAVNLTTQLLTFSKGGKPVKKLIRLEQVVTNAIKFALSGSQTTYVLKMTPNLWPVEVDAGQVAQVVQNIVLNANEAMNGKGSVHISAANTEITGESVPGLPGGGRFVRIEIQDSGKGISEQNLKKIFDPYFTTKEKGSGLGLATSYSIIRNHDGIITVTSEEHRGTTFAIYLPAAKDCRRAEESAVAEEKTAKNGRILLMDDEELVRDVAQKMIMALGHEVQCAGDGETTIDLFRQARESGNPFEVVILDLTVKGGMGGEETINKLRLIDPDVVAIVSSGYAENSVVADFRTFGFSAALNKPYTLAALRNCINELL